MTTSNRAAGDQAEGDRAKADRRRGRGGAKPERKPIFERLAPFAPWDQRSAPALIDETEAARRAAAMATASSALAEATRRLAASDGAPAGVSSSLAHLAEIADWHVSVWSDHLGGRAGDSPSENPAAKLCAQAAEQADPLVALAVLARVSLPRMVADTVMLQAELGDDLAAAGARWLSLVIDDLEAARADTESLVQAQLSPGDGARLARACAEVAKSVC